MDVQRDLPMSPSSMTFNELLRDGCLLLREILFLFPILYVSVYPECQKLKIEAVLDTKGVGKKRFRWDMWTTKTPWKGFMMTHSKMNFREISQF